MNKNKLIELYSQGSLEVIGTVPESSFSGVSVIKISSEPSQVFGYHYCGEKKRFFLKKTLVRPDGTLYFEHDGKRFNLGDFIKGVN